MRERGEIHQDAVAQTSGSATPWHWTGFQGLDVAKRYCRRNSISNRFVWGGQTRPNSSLSHSVRRENTAEILGYGFFPTLMIIAFGVLSRNCSV